MKVFVPFPSATNPIIHLIGVLAQHEPLDPSPANGNSRSAENRPLALMMHGVLSHKNQSYHPLLAQTLPIDSFRFDFRGNDESPLFPGQEWDMASFDCDVEDIDAVLAYLSDHYGYHCDLLIGHSRGSLVGWKWFAKKYGSAGMLLQDSSSSFLPAEPPLWVSLGGRWRMERIHDRDNIYNPAFKEKGYYEWNAKVNRKAVSVRIHPPNVQAFNDHPAADFCSAFPASTPCILIHGTEDETVPCADVAYYLNILMSRNDRVASSAKNGGAAGSLTQVHLVEGGNHMLRGKYREVVDVITNWYRSQRPFLAKKIYRGADDLQQDNTGSQFASAANHRDDILERSWQRSIADSGRNKL